MQRIKQQFDELKFWAVSLTLGFLFVWSWTAEAAAPGNVVVNEIMQNPDAVFDSAGEWFELINTTSNPIDIDGWTIRDEDFDSHEIDNGGPLIIPADGFLILARNADAGTNGGVTVDYQYSGVACGWRPVCEQCK